MDTIPFLEILTHSKPNPVALLLYVIFFYSWFNKKSLWINDHKLLLKSEYFIIQ